MERGIKMSYEEYLREKGIDIDNPVQIQWNERVRAFYCPTCSTVKKIGYKELDIIRKRRNKFVHAILNSNFGNENIMKLQKLYDKDMWVLRLYAQNIFYQANELKKGKRKASFKSFRKEN